MEFALFFLGLSLDFLTNHVPPVGRVLDDPPQDKAAATLLPSSLSSAADVGSLQGEA